MTIKKILPYFLAILSFIIVSLAYFYPVLEGKELYQNDIAHFRGMSKEVREFREANGEEPYWTNRAFGGMPTYQLSTYYPNDYIKKLDGVLRFLPRPADYLFLYLISFFALLLVLKSDWKLAVLGALGFGFSTYLIIILGVGHNAKAHAIAYMPLVLAGILLVFQNRYLWGFVLTALAMALEINASHPQMTYYLLFSVLIFGLVELISAAKQKELPGFFKKVGILFLAVGLSVGVNATSLMATSEYAKESTRSASELTINPDGSPREQSGGLSKDYITEYSFGILETFDLFVPRFMGGSNNEELGKDSYTYRFLKDKAGRQQALSFSKNAPMYWGEQPIVAAPPYLGAVMLFLFAFGAFLLHGTLKKWLVAATIFSLVLSWGKNFDLLTNFFIDYVPLYNKFRAVSSIQVIAELSVPLLGVLGLKEFFGDTYTKEEKFAAWRRASMLVVGLAFFFTAFGTNLFSFESFRDDSFESMLSGLSAVLIEDRRTIFFQDSLRTMIYVVIASGVIWLALTDKLKRNTVILSLVIIVLMDMVTVAYRYVNEDDFISARQLERPFEMTAIQEEIVKDQSHYRVVNFMVNPMNDGSTSFYHNSVGGYHAAKPRRYQELFDFQIARNNFEVLNMLNTKYIIYPGQNGQESVQLNGEANGNAWFVDEVIMVDSADEEIKGLDSLQTKVSAVVHKDFANLVGGIEIGKDSTASIELQEYQPNELIYNSRSLKPGVVVFSEIYYKHGWNAYVDGEPVPHFRANYVLRAMVVPEGEHEIVFRFEPAVIENGSTITLVSFVLLLVIPTGWYFLEKRKNETSYPDKTI